MTLTIELPPEKEAALEAQAQARGLTVVQWLLQLAEQSGESPFHSENQAPDARPVWEIIVDTMKKAPAEDVATLPRDGASQIDHYVYGVPKRRQ